jgi:Xaa-Pro aminopeptidase
MHLRIALLLLLSASALQATDYHARRERLAGKLGKGVLVLFAGTEEEGQNATRGFRQNEDFYYLTGWSEPGAAVVVAAGTEILFLPAHNVSQERWTGPKLGADSPDATRATSFARVDVLDHLRDELVHILPSPTATVFTDVGSSSPATVPIAWLKRANAFPNYVSFHDSRPLIAELRTIKDADEIALLRKAADATVAAHAAAMREVRPGKTENEIAGIIEAAFRSHGCEGPAFSTIVGSGANSTVLHYSKASGTMSDGDVVVIDIGAECGMYASDVTRTLPVNGKFTARQQEIYNIVRNAQQAAIAGFQSGVSTMGRTSPNSLYRIAYDVIETHGLGKYFIHGLSHYVGLNVHDPGDTTKPLQPGAVFTIEPGIYIPEEKIGVRIEDTFLVRADGKLECLSCAAPK